VPLDPPFDLEGHLQDLRPTRERFRRDNGCDSVGQLGRQQLLYLARRFLEPGHDQTIEALGRLPGLRSMASHE